MSKWRAYYTTIASTTVEVEADDYNGALAAAEEYESTHGMPSLCAACSGWGKGYSVDLGEWEPADEKYGPNIEQVDA